MIKILSEDQRSRAYELALVVAALSFVSLGFIALGRVQRAGADYSCLWAGAKLAISSPGKIYDFVAATELQGWPLGPHALRPFIYPPSALVFFLPFALAPENAGYVAWVCASAAFFAWAGQLHGARWWVLAMPSVALVIYCGQVTLLMGGLIMAGLALRARPNVAGILLGAALALKPQLVLLAPVALLAQKRYRTIFVAGLMAAALFLTSSIVWGPGLWLDWMAATARFQTDVIFSNPALVADTITPYAILVQHGISGAWAFPLAPVAIFFVWRTYRGAADAPAKLVALFAGTLCIIPYAMNYELALLAPSATCYLSRTRSRIWLAQVAIIMAHMVLPRSFYSIVLLICAPVAAWRVKR